MYGFIHCCLEDMVIQLFGESAWREILNISGIKLRGASFLMHQVYDDEMTFKLVEAASKVSGLPVEVCLEEFGKHFLVYCQQNGYDQILRVLGSNLFDFLTNLDNLHDHLGSIYPGMRAPSFRVTRRLESAVSSSAGTSTDPTDTKSGQVTHVTEDNKGNEDNGQSMYLHYYSERAGLSPIVKGLVIAVAREFFRTDIIISECSLPQAQSAIEAEAEGAQRAHDHVILKIDKRPSETNDKTSESDGKTDTEESDDEPQDQHHLLDRTSMLNIYNSLSNNEHDSLVDSEIMMNTFPFHVIFDRQFIVLQAGKSLLQVTSRFWKSRATLIEDIVDINYPTCDQVIAPNSELKGQQDKRVKFTDLFRIIRPKIELTFDAIVDHLNQVFVVKTRSCVLNIDPEQRNALNPDWGKSSIISNQSQPSARSSASGSISVNDNSSPGCPFDRISRSRASGECSTRVSSGADTSEKRANSPDISKNQPSLRLKGQMIVLLGGQMCLFLCSPRVDHLNQLMESGIRMSDFALHDRARELMLMSHTHKGDREAVKKLDQATNDLKKMDTKLRQENTRTNEVLHNIFPAKIATLLSHGHKVESESFEMVTCLYSDIIGFTQMCGSENVRPIDIVRLLNTLYLQFDSLTNIHGVFKVETIGDAYVVVGGLPEPAIDHADRCVRMGLDMVQVIRTVRSPADRKPIQMRIGIHSGPVMAGIVGVRVPRYSLFGNTTTLANQLETHGVGGKIHISDFTLRNLVQRDKFIIEPNQEDKTNNPIPFKTYFVTGYRGDDTETHEHEKTLTEQLIKDFEQMTQDELDLVDHSYRFYATRQQKLTSERNAEAQASGSAKSEAPILESDHESELAATSVANDAKAKDKDKEDKDKCIDFQQPTTSSKVSELEINTADSENIDRLATRLSRLIISDSLEQVERERLGSSSTPSFGCCCGIESELALEPAVGCGNCMLSTLLQLHEQQKRAQAGQEINLSLVFHLNPAQSAELSHKGPQTSGSDSQNSPVEGRVCIQIKLLSDATDKSSGQRNSARDIRSQATYSSETDTDSDSVSETETVLETESDTQTNLTFSFESGSNCNKYKIQAKKLEFEQSEERLKRSDMLASGKQAESQMTHEASARRAPNRPHIRPGITNRVKQIRRMDTFGRLKQGKIVCGMQMPTASQSKAMERIDRSIIEAEAEAEADDEQGDESVIEPSRKPQDPENKPEQVKANSESQLANRDPDDKANIATSATPATPATSAKSSTKASFLSLLSTPLRVGARIHMGPSKSKKRRSVCSCFSTSVSNQSMATTKS